MVQGPHPAPPRTPAAPAPAAHGRVRAVAERRATRVVGPEQVTGAQSIVRSLEEAGVEVVFGIPGGAILPTYDPLMDSTTAPPHPRAARAGRRPRGRRATRTRPARVGVVHGDVRPGRDEPRHPDRRRQHGLDPAGRDHRPGRRVAHRHGRVPGGRHRRHHAAGHQAQLPRHRPRRHPARDRRGVPHRLDRPARARCSSTSPSPRCRRAPRSRGRRSSTCPATTR